MIEVVTKYKSKNNPRLNFDRDGGVNPRQIKNTLLGGYRPAS